MGTTHRKHLCALLAPFVAARFGSYAYVCTISNCWQTVDVNDWLTIGWQLVDSLSAVAVNSCCQIRQFVISLSTLHTLMYHDDSRLAVNRRARHHQYMAAGWSWQYNIFFCWAFLQANGVGNQDNGGTTLRIVGTHTDEYKQHQSQPDLEGKDPTGNNYDRGGNQVGNIWREVHIRLEDYIRRI